MAIRLADKRENAVEFGDLINERVGRSGGARVLAFVLAWDRLHTELERAPSPEEMARRFGWDRSTAYRDLELFREATGEKSPERIASLLWDAMDREGRIGALLAVPVVDESDDEEAALRRLAQWEPDLTPEDLESMRRARMNQWS